MIKSLGKKVPDYLRNNLYDMDTFPLSEERFNIVLKGYKPGLPPVKVKKVLGGRYMLIDGRHRMSAVIALGGDSIPCKIVEV